MNLSNLYAPAAGGAGLLVAERMGSWLSTKLPDTKIMQSFALPAAVFAIAGIAAKNARIKPFARGAQIGAAVHVFASFLTSDYDLASY